MSTKRQFSPLMMLIIAVLTTTSTVLAQDARSPTVHHTTAPVMTHPSQGDVREVEGAQAELFTTEDGATMNFRTAELENNHIYTVWWVVINDPDACSESPCPTSEILGTPDVIEADVTWGDGILVSDEGRMEFAAHLPAGEMAESWFDSGFTNPTDAEIHIVINDHGPLIPDMAANMLNTYRGGCTDDSLPPPFPETAKADGEPGPNMCRLVQFAIFQQEGE